jgi:hypothetical protein
MNANAARMAGQMLDQITDNINQNLSLQLLAGFEKQGENIPTKQAAFLVAAWIGMKGIGIFALLFFFGVPLLAMPPEFMSAFYRDWIYSWLPMRFSMEGLRELLYFGSTFRFEGPTLTLLIIIVVSVCVLLGSVLKPIPQKEQTRPKF